MKPVYIQMQTDDDLHTAMRRHRDDEILVLESFQEDAHRDPDGEATSVLRILARRAVRHVFENNRRADDHPVLLAAVEAFMEATR